jgi:hypothetical protein
MNSQINSSEQTAQVTKQNANRIALRGMSESVKDLVKNGQFKNINVAIIETIYKKDGHETFKTFDQWKAEGKSVIKGSKAFYVWGLKLLKATESGDWQTFWPLCPLFSNKQVHEVSKKKDSQEHDSNCECPECWSDRNCDSMGVTISDADPGL